MATDSGRDRPVVARDTVPSEGFIQVSLADFELAYAEWRDRLADESLDGMPIVDATPAHLLAALQRVSLRCDCLPPQPAAEEARR